MANFNESLAARLWGFSFKNGLLDWIIVFFGQYLPYLLVLGFLGFLLSERGRRRLFISIEALLSLLLSRGILTEGIRFFHPAARPFEAWQVTPLISETPGNSFPSGHAAFLFALATTLFFQNRKWGLWFFFFAVLNGFARIAAGDHWPLDIAGGAAIGIASGCIIHLLLKRPRHALMIGTAPKPLPSSPEPEDNGGAA